MAETKKKTTTTKTPVEKTPLEKALEETTAKPAEKKAAKAVKTVEKTAEKAAEPAKAVKKTATRKTAAKKELTSKLTIEFLDNTSYSQEELVKIAKDVWKYDLKKKVGDLTSVALYVKPEERNVYYVFNGTETGSFKI